LESGLLLGGFAGLAALALSLTGFRLPFFAATITIALVALAW
jgi:hypothetical protein